MTAETPVPVTGEGAILNRNIQSYFDSTDAEYKQMAFEHLRSVVGGALITGGFQERTVRHLAFSFEMPLAAISSPEDPLLAKARTGLARTFGTDVAAKIQVGLRPLSETYPEDTQEDVADIQGRYADGQFEVDFDDGRWKGTTLIDYEEMYDRYSHHRKGNVSDEEPGFMREHNRQIVECLRSLGWDVPGHINPDNLD